METRGFVQRVIGAAKLNVATYEAVERDENATIQAFGVVVLASIAAGAGAAVSEGITGLGGSFVQIVMSWIITSAVAYLIGTKLIPGKNTSSSTDELLRTIGFAHAPYLLLFLVFIPVIGAFIFLATWIWGLIAQVVAIRQALDIGTGRAVAVVILSAILLAISTTILALLGLNFGY